MRVLNFKLFVLFVTIQGLGSCSFTDYQINKLVVRQLPITPEIQEDTVLSIFIAPYRQHIDEILDAPLSYAPELLSKTSGTLNTNIGNLMADIVLEQTTGLMLKKGLSGVDLALLNFGGIRSVISPGPVSERTAYEVMPFENTIVVVELTGQPLQEMIEYLVDEQVAHPFSGLKLKLNPDGSLLEAQINNLPVDYTKTYRIATSNYLQGGGDGMVFLKFGLNPIETGYLIRNAMTDYFRKTDTLRTKTDDRFIQISPK